jgi:acylpyruvate hydrolase
VRIEGDKGIVLEGFADVGAVLAAGALEKVAAQAGVATQLANAQFAPVVTAPAKIFCVGLNYRAHIDEMGRTAPAYPALFTKHARALIGAGEAIVLPPESSAVDYEGELAVIIGRPGRRLTVAEAGEVIAGYTVMCDTSMRDWQYRTSQWHQGKTWESSTPLGPWMITADELDPGAELTTRVGGQVVQRAAIADLVFSPAELVSYISTFITLESGDVIATGTPGGVGHAQQPPAYLKAGQEVEIHLSGLGTLRSRVENEYLSAQ